MSRQKSSTKDTPLKTRKKSKPPNEKDCLGGLDSWDLTFERETVINKWSEQSRVYPTVTLSFYFQGFYINLQKESLQWVMVLLNKRQRSVV